MKNVLDMMNQNKHKQTTNNQFVHFGNSKESHSNCHANNLEFHLHFLTILKNYFLFRCATQKARLYTITISFTLNGVII